MGIQTNSSNNKLSPSVDISAMTEASPTPNPPSFRDEMIIQVSDLVLKINETYVYDYYPYENVKHTRGKVMVFSAFDSDPTENLDVESLLPSEMVADSSADNITMLAVFNPRDGRSNVYVAAIYWPEKVLAGPEQILVDYTKENAVNTVLADWVLDLPQVNSLPVFTIIEKVQNTVLEANSTYSPSTQYLTIKGKIMLWNFVINVEAGLKSRWTSSDSESSDSGLELAEFADEEITLFAVVGETNKQVGYYTNGQPAKQIYWDIIVVHFPEMQVVGRFTVTGDYPPSVSYGITTGDILGPTIDWILNIPREE